MADDYAAIVAAHYNDRPHPLAPSIKTGDYPTAVRLASMAKFGGHAGPQEAEMFWKEFSQLGLSPQQFEHALGQMAPLSFVFHGRPPSMHELARFGAEPEPAKVRDYYYNLPDKHHPQVPSGDMIRYLQMAEPHARTYLGRKPLKNEAAMFYAMKAGPNHIEDHYKARQEPKEPA